MLVSLESNGTAIDGLFAEQTVERELLHKRSATWSTSARHIPPLGRLVGSDLSEGQTTHVVEREDGLIRVTFLKLIHTVDVVVAAATPEAVEELLAVLRHQLPPRSAPDDDEALRAHLRFWFSALPTPTFRNRWVDVPAWDAIAGNYAPGTRAALDPLMRNGVPLDGGRLVLWHGEPGTGKTNAVRALAWEWRDHARLHCITDPERLLFQPGYLEHLLLAGGDETRVIVLEDSGELLAPDAKERAGQGLSRLLNVTDGLIGQGVNVLVLITGNEPLERLHPAVARPGRCVSCIEFERFDAAAASAWLGEPAERSMTLAELYARRAGREVVETTRRVGFAA